MCPRLEHPVPREALVGSSHLHAPAQPWSPFGPCPVTGTQECRGDSLLEWQEGRHGPGHTLRRKRRRGASGRASWRRHTQSRPQKGGRAVNIKGEGKGNSVKGDGEGCRVLYAREDPTMETLLFSSLWGTGVTASLRLGGATSSPLSHPSGSQVLISCR